jgi:hypothetical protein
VDDAKARQVAEKDPLLGQREHARDQGLRGDDRRDGRDEGQGVEYRRRGQEIERAGGGLWVSNEERSLAEVVREQGRKNQREPCDADGTFAEVTDVRVESFSPRYHEKHGPQDPEPDWEVRPQESERVRWIDRE